MNTPTTHHSGREGLKSSKIRRFLLIPFCPDLSKPDFVLKKIEDLPVEKLLEMNIKGILLDADGTLGPHSTETFSDSVIEFVETLKKKGFKVAIFTNASEDRFSCFNDIPVVKDVQAKPHAQGFLSAIQDSLLLEDPREVLMAGDNFITDGGAIEVGMRFAYISPIPGPEKVFHRLTRFIAYAFSKFHHPECFKFLFNEDSPP